MLLFFFSLLVPLLTVRTAAAKTILALMEERVTRPVTSSGNVSRVNAVRMLQETSVKLVRMRSIRPIRSRGGSRGRVHGVGGGGRGGPPPPPPRDDLRFSNTTGILQKKKCGLFVLNRARDECTPS